VQHLMCRPDVLVPTCMALVAYHAEAVLRECSAAAAAAAAVAAAGAREGSSGSSDSSSSGSCALDPWAAAEGVLLARADCLQSQAASEQQLGAVLQHTRAVCQLQWQVIGVQPP
jgi:hypothetical protein